MSIQTLQEVTEIIKPQLTRRPCLPVLAIDATDFIAIENNFGREAHESVFGFLRSAIAELKGKIIREEDLIGYDPNQGDYFLVFLAPKRDGKVVGMDDLEALCGRIETYLNKSLAAIVGSYLKRGPRISVGHAIGLPNPIVREERLFARLADEAKEVARHKHFRHRLEEKHQLQELILQGGIRTLFQPIIVMADRSSVTGFEALSRGPSRTSFENPALLFDIAKEHHLIFELDHLCRETALKNAAGMDRNFRIFINCLPTMVQDPGFREKELDRILADINLSPSNIVLEITEREAIENVDLFQKAMSYYSDRGFQIAVDDVGAGYASLEMVVHLRPSLLKLDLSIVRGIHESRVKREVAKTLQNLAQDLDALVIAEGVETEEEYSSLMQIGIPFGQGYLFGRPGPDLPKTALRTPLSVTSPAGPPRGITPSSGR